MFVQLGIPARVVLEELLGRTDVPSVQQALTRPHLATRRALTVLLDTLERPLVPRPRALDARYVIRVVEAQATAVLLDVLLVLRATIRQRRATSHVQSAM